MRIGCPQSQAKLRCRGTVTLRRGAKRIGRRTYSLAAGRSTTVSVTLSRAARRTLARRGKLRVRVSVTNRAGKLRTRTTTRTATLRAARR